MYQFFLKSIFAKDLNNFEQFKEAFNKLVNDTTDKDGIYLSTIHSAKGLEFEYLFVIHMDEGNLPSKRSVSDPDPKKLEKSIDEERRLAYVAFTRAKKNLFLFSSSVKEKVSRFIKEIDRDLLEIVYLPDNLKNI